MEDVPAADFGWMRCDGRAGRAFFVAGGDAFADGEEASEDVGVLHRGV